MSKDHSAKKFHLPSSGLGRTLLSLLITAVVGFVYFYVTLPALNLHDSQFYSFLILLCIIYTVCVFLLSGGMHRDVVTTPKEKVKSWFSFVKSRCLPVLVVLIALLAAAVVGNVLSLPLLRATAYRDLLSVDNGDFTHDVTRSPSARSPPWTAPLPSI